MRYRIGNISAVLAVLLWSLAPALVAICDNVPMLRLIGFSCLITFAVYVVSWIVRGESVREALKVSWLFLPLIVVSSPGVRALSWASIYMTDPMEAIVVHQIWGVLVVFLGLGAAWAAVQWKHILAGLITVIGVVVVVGEGNDPLGGFDRGHAVSMAGGVIWAFQIVLARRYRQMAGSGQAVGYLVMGVLLLAMSSGQEGAWEMGALEIVLVAIAGAAGAGGLFFWDYAARVGNPHFLAGTSICYPLLVVFWMLVLGVSDWNLAVVAGALLIFAGGGVVSSYGERFVSSRNGLETAQ